ncbi:hypothetical protein VNO78_23768 [Psophocarpus tetragonolobus]|uniref:ZF-HD dimerization-type domain-containing protein n=1 Tax=Psophocarpus tetragonolobus TaxID=3891 RepID=A0AAN9S3N3_PSOTE
MGSGSCVSKNNMGEVPPTRMVFNGTKQPHTLLSEIGELSILEDKARVVWLVEIGEVVRVSARMKKRQVVVKRDYATSSAGGNIRYKECQKNHAANTGGYAVDGCREFMASAGEGTSAALTCAACGCHRNFHKKEVLHGIN